MTNLFGEQNKVNPSGARNFGRAEFAMMRRVFDCVCREASIPIGALGFYQCLARMILDMSKSKPSEEKLYAAALKFACQYTQQRPSEAEWQN